MKKSYPTLLATLVWATIYAQPAYADLASQCLLGVPVYNKPLVEGDPNSLPVTITAKDMQGEYPRMIQYRGNVDIKQGNQTLSADNVELTQTEGETPLRMVTATGNVSYDDPQIILKGPRAWSNLNNKDTDIEEGKYQMVGRQGRGYANKMQMRGENRYTIMDKGMFTSCLPGDDSWSVVGSEVILDREEQVAEIWNARFRVANVPVFYSPYLQLPIGDKRRSGFLIPNGNYSRSSGFDFQLPYYWNIAPNYDATITTNYISRRGLKLDNEFRYLTKLGRGTIAVDWINHDSQYNKDKADEKAGYLARDSATRWLFYWGHSGVMNNVWRFNVDYTKVSDNKYFTDFTSQYGNTTDGYATQKFSTGYAQQNWNATLTTKQFQIFSDNKDARAYRAEPQLDLNYYKNDIGPFDFRTYAQFVRFTSVGENTPEANRYHIEPTISLPASTGWASFNNEFKLMATHYDQDIPDAYKKKYPHQKLDDSVNRVLPQFKSDMKVVFERQYDTNDITQTLEPRVQYLYVPYKDQSNINNFDSALLQSNYSGLFRDRMYGGLDRIASANQLTAGVTSRFYDSELVERFNISVGQIYFFERPKTGSSNEIINSKDETGSMVWAGDAYWRITDTLGMRGGLQYDRRLGSVSMGDAIMEYRRDSDHLLQLSYRYVDRDYIQATRVRPYDGGINQLPEYQKGISQIGVVGSWPLAERWGLVGAYYFDTKDSEPVSQMVGLQYNTCCWAVNVGYERKIVGWKEDHSDIDNKWSINLELRGLSNNHSLGSQKMLERGILPYQRAF